MKWELDENILRIKFPKLLNILHRDAFPAGFRPDLGRKKTSLDKIKSKSKSNTTSNNNSKNQLAKKKERKEPLTTIEIKTPEELAFSLPTLLRKSWGEKYDPGWLFDEVCKCFEYYTLVKPESKPKTQRGWTRAVNGWIGRSNNPKLLGEVPAGSICGIVP